MVEIELQTFFRTSEETTNRLKRDFDKNADPPKPSLNICEDIDECSNFEHNCSSHAECQNTPGSFDCECPNLFNGTGFPDSPCTDIDECQDGTHNCDGLTQCNNKLGGYGCKCPSGFLMKGKIQIRLIRL